MNKIYMRCLKGIWIVSVDYYKVHVVCTAGSVRVALRGLQEDMRYIEAGLAHAVCCGSAKGSSQAARHAVIRSGGSAWWAANRPPLAESGEAIGRVVRSSNKALIAGKIHGGES